MHPIKQRERNYLV